MNSLLPNSLRFEQLAAEDSQPKIEMYHLAIYHCFFGGVGGRAGTMFLAAGAARPDEDSCLAWSPVMEYP